MLVLEFLFRCILDDCLSVKFFCNFSCSEDIRWLCSLFVKFGILYFQRFCVVVLNVVVSLFVLYDFVLEVVRYMVCFNLVQLVVNLCLLIISFLVQKSLIMYVQCIYYNLINIFQSEYDEFVELLRYVWGVFCMVLGGMIQFNEFL